MSVRAMAVAFAAVLTLALATARARQSQPSGEEIVNKYIEATGGRDAYAKVNSRAVSGSVALPAQNINGKVNIWQKAPGMVLEVVEIPGVVTERRGYNPAADTGWASSEMTGVRLLEGDELQRIRQEADPQAELNWKKYYTDATTLGAEQVDGVDCWKVQMTTKGGKKDIRYYDKATGLLKRTVAEVEIPQGLVKTDASISDYRDVNGTRMPFKTSTKLNVSGMQLVQNVTIEKVESNVEIPDDKFALPDDVKKLAESAKSGGATTKPAGK